MSDVSILYRNSEIASLSNTGIKTLVTGGKYCDSDIEIQYTKPAAPTPSLQAKTNIAPATTSQTITADSGYDGLSSVQINAMPAGSATTPATTITANPSISVSLFGEITASVSKSQKVTPTVSAGYVSSGTYGTVTVSGSSTEQLTTKAAQTYTPTTADQTISAGQYLTGAQTILGDQNLIPGNIKDGVSIFSVQGNYTGSGGGGMTYDLVLRHNGKIPSNTISKYSVESGTVHDVIEKYENGDIPEAVLICYDYDSVEEEGYYNICRLVYIDAYPYPTYGETSASLYFYYFSTAAHDIKCVEVSMYEGNNSITGASISP